MSHPDELALATALIEKYDDRAAKEARRRRRRAMDEGEGAEAKKWRAVHKIIIGLESDKPHQRDDKDKKSKDKRKD